MTYVNTHLSQESSGTPQQMINTSLPFVGLVSKFNTSLPKLAYRQPLGRLQREMPRQYKPAGASINLRKRIDVLRCMCIQTARPEFAATMARFEDANGDPIEGRWARLPPMEDQKKSIDVLLREWTGDTVDVDTILSNTVHTAPFYSNSMCGYCGDHVVVTSITSWIEHFGKVHKRLLHSTFSCPACLPIKASSIYLRNLILPISKFLFNSKLFI